MRKSLITVVVTAAGAVLLSACGPTPSAHVAAGPSGPVSPVPTAAVDVSGTTIPTVPVPASKPPAVPTSPTASARASNSPTVKPTRSGPVSSPAATSPKPAAQPSAKVSSASTVRFLQDKEEGLLKVLNDRRQALGLPQVKRGTEQSAAARQCVQVNLDNRTFDHCGHEVLYGAKADLTPEEMIDGWFSSPGHRTALTYPSSTAAGPAVGINADGRLVAAVNIDY